MDKRRIALVFMHQRKRRAGDFTRNAKPLCKPSCESCFPGAKSACKGNDAAGQQFLCKNGGQPFGLLSRMCDKFKTTR